MKKLFKVALVAICILSTGSFANAQQKIGYINVDQLMQLMPETKTIQVQMQAYSKTFQDGYTGLQNEFDTKLKAYQAKQATMPDAQKSISESELKDLQTRMTTYQTNAQTSIDAKVQEYLKPVNEKIHTAITAVAKEKGYSYVINSAQTELLVYPEADDLINAVKAKLSLGSTAAAPAATPPSVIKKP